MYKLVSLDMDGTTLGSDHRISARTLSTLRRASASGIEVMMNTGRSFYEAKEYIAQMDFLNYAALANGSVIYDVKAQDFIRIQGLDIALIEETDRIARGYADEVSLSIAGERHTYVESFYYHSKGAERHRRLTGEENLRFVDGLVEQFRDRFIAKGLLLGDHAVLLKIKQKLEDRFGDRIQLVFSLPQALEILDPNTDKSNALARIMEIKDLNRSEVLAIGDGENDIGMLKAAGFSVAMGNATEKLKRVADYITLTNDEDGVVFAIDRFVFGS